MVVNGATKAAAITEVSALVTTRPRTAYSREPAPASITWPTIEIGMAEHAARRPGR